MSRALTGACGFHAGLAAEASVAAHYLREGLAVVARRWRGRAGEIDVIAQDGDELVFIEVKKSRDFASAAARLGPRQIGRILDAAAEFLGTQPLGQSTPVRFDVALVDRHGRIEVLENALGP